jgi:peptide/nickel transport system permease protein
MINQPLAMTAPLPGAPFVATGLLRRHATIVVGCAILASMIVAALAAPLIAPADPMAINPLQRLREPSSENWLGTDHFGRDILTRIIYGARVSLAVGAAVAAVSVSIGLAIGLICGYLRLADAIVMRVMDGLMSIPAILLAVALMALTRASMTNVIIAISVTEIPRVVRLVRAVVLTIREEAYVQAAIATGARLPVILVRHILPNTIGPLIVQGTYIFAAAIIIEAALSFLGAGTPPTIPSWGNMISEGGPFLLLAWWVVIVPGAFLSIAVLAVNLLGDGLRDALDPRLVRQM